VTNLDAKLQKVVEDQLLAAVARAQQQGYPGSAGAAVVIDVRNGHVLSMASYPTYDPAIWVGGVTAKQYQQLQESDSLSSNAYQGLFAPGSTFKVISTTAAGKDGFNLYGSYDCPASLKIGTQTFRNFESSGYGSISLSRAIEVSCNTVFYEIADRMWQQAGGITATKESADPIAEAARMYGLGSPTGIDLPGEAGGRISSRLFKSANWNAMKDTWCANAKAGYPQTRQQNPALAEFYTAIDAENCKDGYQWRVGDALNAAIGQGDTVVTPLQMAMVYAAVANGGTVYQPQIAKALVSPEGKVVKTFDPVVKSTINVPKSTMNFLHATLPGVTSNGTAETPFAGFPLGQIPVAAKTGSAQVTGNKPSTSWFASYAPADNPKYAIVMMIAQGGTGSKTSGPSVRKIYEALFGISGKNVDPASSVLMGGRPRDALPVFRPDGTPVGPSGKESGVVAQRNDPTSSSSNGSG
jgi:penicillin-binding protein 2